LLKGWRQVLVSALAKTERRQQKQGYEKLFYGSVKGHSALFRRIIMISMAYFFLWLIGANLANSPYFCQVFLLY
jgi:hypothetical protein